MGEIMEQIFIEKLKVFGYHGVYEQEKTKGQVFLVDCLMDTCFDAAVATDALANTVDYGNVCLFIRKYFEENAYDLLEKAADGLLTELLYAFPAIQKVRLRISKPDAPIPMEFDTVGVQAEREWTRVAISIGSNIEPKEQYLTEGMEALIANAAFRNMVVSDYIETDPYGYVKQDTFLNGAAVFETILSPRELLTTLHEIENNANRTREIHWGPRTLDLDILLYGNHIMNTKELTIPHIDMCNRAFVLEPLASIAPGMVHPVCHKTIYDLNTILKQKNTSDGRR